MHLFSSTVYYSSTVHYSARAVRSLADGAVLLPSCGHVTCICAACLHAAHACGQQLMRLCNTRLLCRCDQQAAAEVPHGQASSRAAYEVGAEGLQLFLRLTLGAELSRAVIWS